MSRLTIQEQEPGRFIIDGDLTFSSIDKNTVKSFPFRKTAKQLTFDLKRVKTTDSAGLALIIEWIKYTQKNNIQLLLENIPEQLLSIARLSGVEQMIQPAKSAQL